MTNHRRIRRSLRAITPLALSALPLAIAHAQTAPVDATPATATPPQPAPSADARESGAGERAQLGDIVVTARRRQENLLAVPIAVSALTSAGIEARGLTSIRDLAQFTPGLYVESNAAISSGRDDRTSNQLSFRGLSVASGATFINGVPYSGPGMPDVADVARVEVLKGPQAVYFGRSTYSGAVNYVTKDPSSTFGGWADITGASYGKYDGHLALEGPIIGDAFTVRGEIHR